MKALIITGNRFEDSELIDTRYILEKKGVEVVLATPDGESRIGKHGNRVQADEKISEVSSEDFDALIIPGGSSPKKLVEVPEAVQLVKAFHKKRKPIAAICHGPQLLAAAGIVEGRKLTCYSGLKDELEKQGVDYENSSVVVDGNIITSRVPKDISDFSQAILKKIREQ